MLNHLKTTKSLLKFCHCIMRNNYRLLETTKPFVIVTNLNTQVRLYGGFQPNFLILEKKCHKFVICRYKSKGKKKRSQHNTDDDDDGDDEYDQDNLDDDIELDKTKGSGVEVKTYGLQSLRVDLVLKSILGYNRKQVEELFYENNLRFNGKILHKKSKSAKQGDTIDVIRGFSSENPSFLRVGRVEILSINPDTENDKILVKVRKYKSVIIDNYPDGDQWHSQEASV